MVHHFDCCSSCLKLVLDGMQKHAQSLHVQLVATACVFNLTNQDLTVGLPLRLLSAILSQLLEAMKNFPNHQQVTTLKHTHSHTHTHTHTHSTEATKTNK